MRTVGDGREWQEIVAMLDDGGGGYGSEHRTAAASPMTGSTMAVAAA